MATALVASTHMENIPTQVVIREARKISLLSRLLACLVTTKHMYFGLLQNPGASFVFLQIHSQALFGR
jgi:hypothetical protein